ncbi:hypothetical protein D3C81_1746070 [compost metagenome]
MRCAVLRCGSIAWLHNAKCCAQPTAVNRQLAVIICRNGFPVYGISGTCCQSRQLLCAVVDSRCRRDLLHQCVSVDRDTLLGRREGGRGCFYPDIIRVRGKSGHAAAGYLRPGACCALLVFHPGAQPGQCSIGSMQRRFVGFAHAAWRCPTGRHVQRLRCAVLRCGSITWLHDA